MLCTLWLVEPEKMDDRVETKPNEKSFTHTSYAMLSSGIPWNMPRVTCIFRIHTSLWCKRRKYKWQVACSMISHEEALHNFFIPCLNLRKTYGNFRKSSEISGNFRKLRKCFKPVFDLRRFMKILEIFGKLRERSKKVLKCSKNLQECSEIFRKLRKRLKRVFRCFYDFL